MEVKKKLIEVALPLDKINEASTYEKMPGIGPHPRGLHLWWARRPLAAARAVIWSSLVDDPSSHPELFPTEEDQNRERERLFRILEDLVVWENSNNEEVLEKARAEILKYTDGHPPALLDPFAGGGAIPLEAQRLGLKAHAHDLNPVAVMINKAMIEIPPRFANMPPVNPEARAQMDPDTGWRGPAGLAEDVRYYAEWMKEEAYKRIGHLYPTIKLPPEMGSYEATVISWIWVRTVKCPNPACGCNMPLASSFILSSKKANKAYIVPDINKNNKSILYSVQIGNGVPPDPPKIGRGAKFRCIVCGGTVSSDYVKSNASAGNLKAELMAIVADGPHGRIYLSPNDEHESIAKACCYTGDEMERLPNDPRAIWCVNYGLTTYDKLFTNRQLTALTTFTDLVAEAKQNAEADAKLSGLLSDGLSLNDGGHGAKAYGEAISIYLSFAVDRLADFSTSVSRWSPSNEKPMNCFNKQGIAMTWDFPEANPFSNAVGSFSTISKYISDCILKLPSKVPFYGSACQFDAQSDCHLRNTLVSTDPPYYDNIGYADLSDFFYVWMRKSLKDVFPDLFKTVLVPKANELVAVPYRFNGDKNIASKFFEQGMFIACNQLYNYSDSRFPVTIYYAYKQSEKNALSPESNNSSTGWETMLSAIINSGFSITGTWPMRTEQTYRSIGLGTNALASSIILVCRKRQKESPISTRRKFITELRRELRPALQTLQKSNIAPVDMAQSAIGPGMAIFSRYSKVIEADGTPMTVRTALQIINQELDLYFNDQDGSLDSASRFCVDLYTQYAFNDIQFGQADTLARAKNISVAALANSRILYAQKGIVHLYERPELPEEIDSTSVWLLTQQLTRAMENGGVQSCAVVLMKVSGLAAEQAKSLAYRLYQVADRKKWAKEALAYNSLVISWADIQERVSAIKTEQQALSVEESQTFISGF